MFSVLITGSSRGIGLELTKQFVTHHDPPDTVIATCRNPSTADELRSLMSRFNNLVILELDVNKVETFPRLVERVTSIVGSSGLNVLINNAGIVSKKSNLEDVIYDEYLNVLHTNTVAPVFLTQALLPLIKRAAAVNDEKEMCIKKAAVINISSVLGSVSLTTRGYWGYNESKAALNQASRLLSANVETDGILVVDIHPGSVKTDMGGPQASLTTEESVREMMDLFYNLSEYENDSFLRFDGEELPW
ncbi:hypothetical protein RUM44_001919 [Polyplax serrata]|uniref:Uncharacterized protein n=1 Tax=Polyplax serrata TaxID=468196 RepID=A0ABR1ALE9_POLSC